MFASRYTKSQIVHPFLFFENLVIKNRCIIGNLSQQTPSPIKLSTINNWDPSLR